MSEPIVITVERLRYGHESCLRNPRVTEGEPYVRACHAADTLGELTCSLAETGHAFEVRIEDRHVSLIDFMVATGRSAELDAPLGGSS